MKGAIRILQIQLNSSATSFILKAQKTAWQLYSDRYAARWQPCRKPLIPGKLPTIPAKGIVGRLWCVEKWTDKKGKTDSLYYTDDVTLKDGKIMIYDEEPSVSAANFK